MKFKVNKKYVVDAKSHEEAVKATKLLKDSAASDIVREIKSKYPQVQIEVSAQKSRANENRRAVRLKFSNYPTENPDNWLKFLKYLYNKYTNDHPYNHDFNVFSSAMSFIEQIGDSVKDSIEDEEVSLDYLIKDEIEAINGYKAMIAKTKNPKLLDVLSHILSEEVMHVEELRNAQSGNFEIVDNVKDEFYDMADMGEHKRARIIAEHPTFSAEYALSEFISKCRALLNDLILAKRPNETLEKLKGIITQTKNDCEDDIEELGQEISKKHYRKYFDELNKLLSDVNWIKRVDSKLVLQADKLSEILDKVTR